jgi:16S rRNA (cytosine967-C5)-methyltransferase
MTAPSRGAKPRLRGEGQVDLDSTVTPARRVAFEVVRRSFEHGAWADRALRSAAARHGLEGRERAQAQRLAYGAVQRRGTSDHLIERLADRPASGLDAPALAALRLGLFELLFADATPDHAAVDQAVELAKGNAGARRQAAAGLVNAVLRRAAREREELLGSLVDATPQDAALAHSYPEWIAQMWWEELGPAEARALMAAMNEPAETALRVNTIRADPSSILSELRAAGDEVERPNAPSLTTSESLVVRGRLGALAHQRIAEGALVAQSRASQAVVALLDPQPGERVLDLCAAPGVKTTAIAARMRNEGEIVAVELDPARARTLRELGERLGVTCVRVVEGDAASADLEGGYDRILVDPPCSDLGALASRPDARWRKSPELIERLARIQEAILARAAGALRPGGKLVYATCTISVRENEQRIAALCEHDRTVVADDLGAARPELASSHQSSFLQTRPDRDRTDGFFIARLQRDRAEPGPAEER